MFRDALNNLSSLTVEGISTNYAIDAVPEHLNRGQLPVLLVMPLDFGNQQRLFRDRGSGFESLGFSNGLRTVTYLVTHLLLVAPVQSGAGFRQHLPPLVDLIDNYFSAFAPNSTLDDALLEPAEVRIEPGTFTYGGVDYFGCAFRHKWVVQV